MTDPLRQGSIIGILGGGQLGRMLSVAASRLGYRCHIFEPGAAPPAGQVAEFVTTATYADEAALAHFGQSVDVITYEFENVPTSALDLLESLAPIRPGRNALRISQDRLVEKTFLRDQGLSVAPFVNIDWSADSDLASRRAALQSARDQMGTPSIVKTRRFGYDGKGQFRLSAADGATEVEAICDDLAGAAAILEGFVPFEAEVSIIAARDLAGRVRCYDVGQNVHVDGILRTTTVPAAVDHSTVVSATEIAGNILEALEYVGVLGVELFVTEAGLVVNEIAPRVHNSGHWTQNGCVVDQFEQHVRAVAGLPVGDPARHCDVVMENLIGDDLDAVPDLLDEPGVAVHLYGKAECKPGRKMGHVNRALSGT